MFFWHLCPEISASNMVVLSTHIEKGDYVTDFFILDGEQCEKSGIKTPVTERPLFYVCKRKHDVLIVVIHLFSIEEKW